MEQEAQLLSRRNKWLLGVVAPITLLLAVTVWLLATTSGLLWMLGVTERHSRGTIHTQGLSGSLLEPIGIQQLVLRGEGWRVTLNEVILEWHPTSLLQGKLNVQNLHVRKVDVLVLASDKPATLPLSLRLPLEVRAAQIGIDTLNLYSREGAAADFSASAIRTGFESDAKGMRLQKLHAQLAYGDLNASAEILSDTPFALQAHTSLDTPLQLSGRPEHTHFVADARGDLQQLTVELKGTGAGVSVTGTAQLAPFSAITVSRVRASFSGMVLQRFLADAPSAEVSGSVDLSGAPGGILQGTMQLRNAHAAPLNRKGLPLLGIDSNVRLSTASWSLEQIDARLPNDGHITGDLTWEVKPGKGIAQLKVLDLDTHALDTRLPKSSLQGDIIVDSAGNNQHAVVVLGDGKLALVADLKRQADLIELADFRLTRGETVLAGHGQLALDRRRTFRLSSKLRKLNLSEFAATPATELNAELEASGFLLPEVEGTLQFDLTDSHFAQYNISGNGHLEFAGLQRVTGDAAVLLGDNRLNMNVLLGTAADRIQLTLDAPKLEQLGNGLGGQLAGQATLSGSVDLPRLQFNVQAKQLVFSDAQHIDRLDATGDLAEAALHMKLELQGFHNKAPLQIPQASFELQGSGKHHTVQLAAQFAQAAEALEEIKLTASGGLDTTGQSPSPGLWSGALDSLAASGVLPFNLLAATPLKFDRESVMLGKAQVAISGGQVNFSETAWTPQRWHSAGNFSGINLRAVNLQHEKPIPQAVETMRFGGDWSVTQDDHWQGHLQAQRESGDWVVDGSTGLKLGLQEMRLSLNAEQDQLHAKLHASGERLGTVDARAMLPLIHTTAGWTILPESALSGQLKIQSDDLSWLGPMLDSNLQSGGRLKLDADLAGTFLAPRLRGRAQGDSLVFGLLDQGVQLEQGALDIRFEPATVFIDRLAFTAPLQAVPRDNLLRDYKLSTASGKVSASGRFDLDGGTGEVQIHAQHLPLAQRTDRWIIASGTGQARYDRQRLIFDGNIRADAGLINQPVNNRPRWADDMQMVGLEPPEQTGPSNSVRATLDLGDHFYIRASGLEARLAGQLDVRSEDGEALSVTGIIAAQDALFDAFGQRLQVDRGMVNFQGPLDDPGLNILALRKGLSVEAGVEVTGTVRHPIVHLVSTPSVPDAEKLSWIVLGRVPDSSGIDTTLLIAAAGNILGGQSVGQLGRALGVDELSLKQQAGGDPLLSQKVTVGKRLSSRAFISYEQGLSDVGGVTKFTYTLSPRFTIITRTGTEDALELFYSFRFY